MSGVRGARAGLPGDGALTAVMDEVECTVIGAGVVGLAVAAALARAGREVLVLEQADGFGSGVSARNSEIIHAGLYHPAGSLKTRLCVSGKEMLYRYCRERTIPHARCSKLVVATTPAETTRLQQLQHRAEANGVRDLECLNGKAAKRLEPALSCLCALHSPSSGMIDSHTLMLSLCADIEAAAGTIVFSNPCQGGRLHAAGGAILTVGGTGDGTEVMRLRTRLLVNCTGLGAQALAHGLEGFPPACIPPLHFGKGNYFVVDESFPEPPFSRLIYPLPGRHSLGIHLTCTLDGKIRLGPDLQWADAPDYQVDAGRAVAFEAAVRRYWPDMPRERLRPDYAGVRPKLSGEGEATADFQILGAAHHGQAGIIHLFGIESPGLTSCLAMAEYVASLVAQ